MKAQILLPVWSIARREFVGFFRSPGRWIGSLGTPLILWAILAIGFGSVASETLGRSDTKLFAYFFPGMVLLMVVFSAIFSSISLIEDRRIGFLQGVLVSPAPRVAIVLGKVLGGSAVAAVQGLLLFAIAPLAGVEWTIGTVVGAFLSLLLVTLTFSAFSFVLAWRADSVQSFHSTMNFVLLPMWLLSGSFFSVDGSPEILRWSMRINPLYYGFSLFSSFTGTSDRRLSSLGGTWADAAICFVFLIVFLGIAQRGVRTVGMTIRAQKNATR